MKGTTTIPRLRAIGGALSHPTQSWASHATPIKVVSVPVAHFDPVMTVIAPAASRPRPAARSAMAAGVDAAA